MLQWNIKSAFSASHGPRAPQQRRRCVVLACGIIPVVLLRLRLIQLFVGAEYRRAGGVPVRRETRR